jgi:hypothetical protein
MKPYISHSRESSEIKTDRHYIYYGPIVTDEKGEWCCVINKNGKEVARYSNSQLLDVGSGESPKDMLIAAISLYLR